MEGSFSKIFDSMDRVELKGNNITKIITQKAGNGGVMDSEEIELTRPVAATGFIEHWLAQLLTEMRASIKSEVCKGSEALPLKEFLDRNCAQVSLLGIQFLWTADVDDALSTKTSAMKHRVEKYKGVLDVADNYALRERQQHEPRVRRGRGVCVGADPGRARRKRVHVHLLVLRRGAHAADHEHQLVLHLALWLPRWRVLQALTRLECHWQHYPRHPSEPGPGRQHRLLRQHPRVRGGRGGFDGCVDSQRPGDAQLARLWHQGGERRATQRFTIKDDALHSGQQLSVTSINITGPQASWFQRARPMYLDGQQEVHVDVLFDPTSSGPARAFLAVQANDSDSPRRNIPLDAVTDVAWGVKCGSIDSTAGQNISRSASMAVNIGGTVVGVTLAGGSSLELHLQVVNATTEGCGGMPCGEQSGSSMVRAPSHRYFWLTFDTPVAVAQAQFFDLDQGATNYWYWQDESYSQFSSTAYGCGSSFGCYDGEFITFRGETTPEGNRISRAYFYSNTNDAAEFYMDNIRICVIDGSASRTTNVQDLGVPPLAFQFLPTSYNQIPTEYKRFYVSNDGIPLSYDLNVNNIFLLGPHDDQYQITDKPRTFPVMLAPGHEVSAGVLFAPDSEGDKYAFLVATSNDPQDQSNSATAEGNVLVNASFTAPLSNLTSFGIIPINRGSTTIQTFTITNNADSTQAPDHGRYLVIGGITVAGRDAADLQMIRGPRTPLSVPPGKSVTMDILFDPTTTGNKRAYLTVNSNDPDRPTVTVQLDALADTPWGFICETFDFELKTGYTNGDKIDHTSVTNITLKGTVIGVRMYGGNESVPVDLEVVDVNTTLCTGNCGPIMGGYSVIPSEGRETQFFFEFDVPVSRVSALVYDMDSGSGYYYYMSTSSADGVEDTASWYCGSGFGCGRRVSAL